MATNEEELKEQIDSAKTKFLSEKPTITTMLGQLNRNEDKVSDGTAIVYFEAIQEYIHMPTNVSLDILQRIDNYLTKAMENFPAIGIQ